MTTPDREAAQVRLMTPEGAHSENGISWYAREHFPTRAKVRTAHEGEADVSWIDIRVLARYARFAPELPEADYYDGEYWVECPSDAPGAFPVWRCE